jgi:hypothetical protein
LAWTATELQLTLLQLTLLQLTLLQLRVPETALTRSLRRSEMIPQVQLWVQGISLFLEIPEQLTGQMLTCRGPHALPAAATYRRQQPPHVILISRQTSRKPRARSTSQVFCHRRRGRTEPLLLQFTTLHSSGAGARDGSVATVADEAIAQHDVIQAAAVGWGCSWRIFIQRMNAICCASRALQSMRWCFVRTDFFE